MGAEEKAVDEVDNEWSVDLGYLVDKLDRGYALIESADGQLRLIAPSPVDPLDNPTAAA